MLFCCCRLEIEVAYYERKKGVLVKVTEVLINAKDAPLSETLMSALPEVRRAEHVLMALQLDSLVHNGQII